MTFREKGITDPDFPHSLPFHSVDTPQQAKDIQTFHCRLSYDGNRYLLNSWAGKIEDVYTLAKTLEITDE